MTPLKKQQLTTSLSTIQQHFIDLNSYLADIRQTKNDEVVKHNIQQILANIESLKPYEETQQHNPQFITSVGDQCLQTIIKIANDVGKTDGVQTKREIEHIALPLAVWLCQHGAEIHTLKPVVNAIAQTTNKAQKTITLERLFNQVSTILQHVNSTLLELSDNDNKKAWRVLLVNHGIIATRAQNTAFMETAYQNLSDNSPEDAPKFFEQGMAQMLKMTYPEHVKSVVEKYFLKWREPSTLH